MIRIGDWFGFQHKYFPSIAPFVVNMAVEATTHAHCEIDLDFLLCRVMQKMESATWSTQISRFDETMIVIKTVFHGLLLCIVFDLLVKNFSHEFRMSLSREWPPLIKWCITSTLHITTCRIVVDYVSWKNEREPSCWVSNLIEIKRHYQFNLL